MDVEDRAGRLRSSLGKLPEGCDRNIVFIDQTPCEGYIRYRIEYNTETDETVSAFLLMPDTAEGNLAAVVAAHQHNAQYDLGKSETAGLKGDTMYHYGKEMAELGFVVICPDHLGFEERLPAPEDRYLSDDTGALNERELFCKAIMNGSTLQAKYLSDLSAAVDILCSLPSVDSSRIGVIGHSLGGQEALWLTFYDERVKAGVSSCGFSTVEAVFNHHIPHNFAMFTFGGLPAGDTVALLEEIGLAGKAFMLTNGLLDPIFPMDGVRKLERAAGAFRADDAFQMVVFEGQHSFPEEIRRKAYRFLADQLKAAE